MKKSIIMLLLPISLIMGQEDMPELPGWGVYVGYGLMSASGDSLPDDVTTVGLPGFGVSKGLMVGPLPMQAGIGLHGRGYKIESEGATGEMTANYLDVWANVPYPVGPAFLALGINVGTFLGGKTKTEGAGFSLTTDLEDDALGLDFGLNVGLGMPIGDTGAQVGVLYLLGLAEPTDGLTFNGIFFNAGYSF